MRQIDRRSINFRLDAIAMGVCLLLAVAVFFIALKPTFDRETDRLRQRNLTAQKHEQAEQAAATLHALRHNLMKFRQAAQQSAVRLQASSQLNQRLAEIADLATRSGLQVHEVQPGGIISGDRFETVPVQMAGEGSYQSCARFLSQLHEAFPDTGVSSLELTGSPAAPGQTAKFRMGLSWFAAPVPATPPPPAGATASAPIMP